MDGTTAYVITSNTSRISMDGTTAYVITSNSSRPVDTTLNIKEPLPNAVFTLPTHLISSIMRIGADDTTMRTRFAICRKFYLSALEYTRDKQSFDDFHTQITVSSGRVFAVGSNAMAQCGVPVTGPGGRSTIDVPVRVRVPLVLKVWYGSETWFVETIRGLFLWGKANQDDAGPIWRPRRIPIDGEVVDVHPAKWGALLKTTASPQWLAFGDNGSGQLGLGIDGLEHRTVHTPTPMPYSEEVEGWITSAMVTFGLTRHGPLTCGFNSFMQCGVILDVMIDEYLRIVPDLTPVELPEEVKSSVQRVLCSLAFTIFMCGDRSFITGLIPSPESFEGPEFHETQRQSSGSGPRDSVCAHVLEMSVPVTIAASCGDSIAFVQGGNVFVFLPNGPARVNDLPDTIVKLAAMPSMIAVQLETGMWVAIGMGSYLVTTCRRPFDLKDGFDRFKPVTMWTEVNDDVAATLNAMEPGDDLAVLPHPIKPRSDVNSGYIRRHTPACLNPGTQPFRINRKWSVVESGSWWFVVRGGFMWPILPKSLSMIPHKWGLNGETIIVWTNKGRVACTMQNDRKTDQDDN